MRTWEKLILARHTNSGYGLIEKAFDSCSFSLIYRKQLRSQNIK